MFIESVIPSKHSPLAFIKITQITLQMIYEYPDIISSEIIKMLNTCYILINLICISKLTLNKFSKIKNFQI